MSYEAERQAITQAFKTAWIAGSNLPVQYENTETDLPTDGSPYLAFSIMRGQSAQVSMVSSGQARFRHPGVVQIDVSVGKGKGTRIGLVLIDEITAILRGQIVSGIIFRAPDIRRMLEPETSRHRYIITFPFHRDTTFNL